IAGELHQTLTNVAGAIGLGKELAGFLLERQGNAEIALEECALLRERPCLEHAAHQMRRRVGDETLGCQNRWENVASAAAADQNLAAAVCGALEERRFR